MTAKDLEAFRRGEDASKRARLPQPGGGLVVRPEKGQETRLGELVEEVLPFHEHRP